MDNANISKDEAEVYKAACRSRTRTRPRRAPSRAW